MTATATTARQLTYTIEPGQYGDVHIFLGTKHIASNMKVWTLRMDPVSMARMENWIGFNMWRWLGIVLDRLPHGVTQDDVRDAYLVARDEVAEMGDCVPA